jgi:DNA-binding transcriptional ArsR family regulator
MILQFLSPRGPTPAMEIVDALPLSQPACSRHLSELLKAGLLKSRTRGSQVLYRLDPKALERFCRTMSKTLHP